MPDFHAFLTQKYPLYADTEIKVNLTVKQLCELNEEFVNSPVFEVKVVDECAFKCDSCGNCLGGEKEQSICE